MPEYQRYAVYFAPERDSALAYFGNAWMGFDPDTGRKIARPELNGISTAQISRLAGTPSRYGFHGTLKAPFRLPRGRSFADMDRAIESLSAAIPSFEIDGLEIRPLGNFLAMVPDAPAPALNQLADTCVAELDRFRAPPCENELNRYRELTTRQHGLLRRWGYPYVMTEFRFHLTLSDKLERPQLERLNRVLHTSVMPELAGPVPVREISLFGDPGAGKPFRLIRRYPLGGGKWNNFKADKLP